MPPAICQPARIKIRLALLWLILTGVIFSHAQPVNVQQFQNTQQAQQLQKPLAGFNTITNAPEIYPGENADTGPQRILRRTPRPDYFDIFFDSQVFCSDNANFAEGPAIIGSAVFVNTGQIRLHTAGHEAWAGNRFAPSAGYVGQWYNYGENNQMTSLDFSAQTFFINNRYNRGQPGSSPSVDKLHAPAGSQNGYNWTYQEYLPAFTVQRIFPVNDQFLFVIGNQVDYHFTSEPPGSWNLLGINNRFDEAVSLTLSWQITRQLSVQPYYRFMFSNYRYNTLQTSDRNDYLNSFGFTLAYYVDRNLSIRTFLNYNIKTSDDPYTPAYHELNGGVGASR